MPAGILDPPERKGETVLGEPGCNLIVWKQNAAREKFLPVPEEEILERGSAGLVRTDMNEKPFAQARPRSSDEESM